MDYQEVLRSIHLELTDPIWEEAKVKMEISGRFPKWIKVRGMVFSVEKVIAVLPGYIPGDTCFVVETSTGEIFTLILKKESSESPRWIVYLRVLRDEELMKFFREERKMMVNMALKRVADFHGHLCPDLVIGCKACELAFKKLGKGRMEREGLIVISQNVTSSLDAIQLLTGCTLGNRGLQVEDWGKHIYQFILQRSGICLEVKLDSLPLPSPKVETMRNLEAKIMDKRATLDEMISYQVLLDEMVRGLIGLDPENLFSWRMLEAPPVVEPIPTTVRRCTRCGDMVAEYGMVDLSEGPICKRCLAVGRSSFPEN